MARLFISYARSDLSVVVQLVAELREMGHEPFYDQDLTGGQRWWDVLLDRIQVSDAFLPVLSEAYADSEACRLEAQWASRVGVPLLPLDLGSIGPELCDANVAEANWIRYGLDDRSSIARLARALASLPQRGAPSEEPVRPPVPITYLTATRQEIRDPAPLTVERQLAIVTSLRAKLGTDEEGSARALLADLRRRPDVAHASAVEIDGILDPAMRAGAGRGLAGIDRSNRWLPVLAAVVAVGVIVAGTAWVVGSHGGGDGGDGTAGGPASTSTSMSTSMSTSSNSMSSSTGSTSGSMPGSMSGSPSPGATAAGMTIKLMDVIARANNGTRDGSHPIPPESCHPVSATGVTCSNPATDVFSVDLRLYGSTQTLYDAYEAKVAEVSGQPLEPNNNDCSRSQSEGEVSWNHNQRHSRKYTVQQLIDGNLNEDSQAAGRVFCMTMDNAETMVWTQNPSMLAVVVGAPPPALKRWWFTVHHLIACIGSAPSGMSMCQGM